MPALSPWEWRFAFHDQRCKMVHMKKYPTRTLPLKDRKPKEWPIVVYLWMFGLALTGYIVGRFALSTWPHPYHWLTLLIGGAIGIGVGWLWYRWRGDLKF